jgi:hypothetical protein
MTAAVDAELQDWADLEEREWPTLMLGNGLSINLWSGFGYTSLFNSATLTDPAQAIFDELGTTNFEQCLECLHHANIALRALSDSTANVDRTYEEVRDALFATVGHVHVPWDDFPDQTHELLATTMDRHDGVYTTSYDLSLYWSHMRCIDMVDIKDFFWNRLVFDPTDTAVHGRNTTRVYYLHGGIHLWQDDQTGNNGKWSAGSERLLDIQARYGPTSDKRPLFVSEGTSQAKVRTIRKSSYLSFCLDELRADDKPTVVFGQSLSSQDAHIVDALVNGPTRRIAVSLYPSGDDDATISEKARIIQALGRHKVEFFDSTTHPIGDPAITIPKP